MQETGVLIAGGGPVGLMLAMELGGRGIRCTLVNEGRTTATHPKANAISSRTMEHLRRFGVSHVLRRRGLAGDHPTDVSYFTSLTGHEIGRLRQPSRDDALAMAQAGTGDWPSAEPPHRCSQLFLEQEMFRCASAMESVELRFGTRLQSFDVRGGAVEAIVRGLDADVEERISATYLVGADGGSSLVRKGIGVEFEGESGIVRPMMGGPMYAAYLEAPDIAPLLPERRAWQYWIVQPDFRALLIHVDDAARYVLHYAVPAGREAASVDPADILRRAVGVDVPVRILSATNWTAGYSLVAQRYRRGPVFLAGDAAHLFTPTGGMGMNTGVDDAVNLGWKLAASLEGWGGDALLDSYEVERRPVGFRNVNFARGFADSVGNVPIADEALEDGETGRAARAALKERFEHHAWSEFIIPGIFLGLRYDGSPIVIPDAVPAPASDPNRYESVAQAGGRAPHVWVGERSLHDLLGRSFTLLRFAEVDALPMTAAAAGRGVPLDVVDIRDAAVREVYGTELALIRPDQHIAWRGDRLDRAAEILDLATGHTGEPGAGALSETRQAEESRSG